jgi:transcriptional regulator with XRE-family HTH domain
MGQRIRDLRTSLGFTLAHVAQAIGVTHQQFQKYEKGTDRITCGRLWQIAQFFQKPPGYFFPNHEPQPKD